MDYRYHFPQTAAVNKQADGSVDVIVSDGMAFPEAGPVSDNWRNTSGSTWAAFTQPPAMIGQIVKNRYGPEGHGSELIALIDSGWDFKRHEDGKMYDPKGNLISAPETGETVLGHYPSVRALLDDALRVNFVGEIKIDGNTHQQGRADMVVGYGSNADGSVTRLAQSPVPVPPQVAVIPVPQGADRVVEIPMPNPQSLQRTSGMTAGQTVTYTFTAKGTFRGINVRVSERPGSVTTPHTLRGFINGAQVYVDDRGNSAPNFMFGSDGVPLPKDGDEVRVSITNGENNTNGPADVLTDISVHQ